MPDLAPPPDGPSGRRTFLKLAALAPLAAGCATIQPAAGPAAPPAPVAGPAPDPNDPLAAVRAVALPEGSEPAFVFRALGGRNGGTP